MNEFWFDYHGCVANSPIMFKFDFCVDIQGLADAPDCQSADIYQNVLEDAINEGCGSDHGLSETDAANFHDERALDHDPTTADSKINKVGDVTLEEVDGSTVCGGSLGGQGFINESMGTLPDIEAAQSTKISVCGEITVEEEECKEEGCLREHYDLIVHRLEDFVNLGDLTLAINNRAKDRLPPVPELYQVSVVPFTFKSHNLLLPVTVTGDLNTGFYFGSNPTTCDEKAVFLETEQKYNNLHDCCLQWFGWNVEQCCADGGGCPELGIEARAERFFPTWISGRLCDSKTSFYEEEESFATLDECCDKWFADDLSCYAGEP